MNIAKTNGQGPEAVMYLRVSTPEQADPLNLKNQEDGCRRLAIQRGIAVAEVILGPGESGRTADRPSFVRLLSYCKAHHKRIGYVIVESLSRFARNVADQGAAIAELRENGIALLSVAEPNVDNTAAGRMAAGVHGVFNQYFSDALSEKMKDRSAASVRAGRWPWAAPLGYINDLKLGNGANIKPDPSSAPLVREAFELYATGRYTKIQVLKIISDKGLETKRGQKLTAQTFDAILRKGSQMFDKFRFKQEEYKKLKAELLRAKLRGEVSQADYVQANADFDDEIEGITQQIEAVRPQHRTLDSFLSFSKLMLVDVASAWQRADAEQKLRVQTFLFREGVAYHQEQKFLNTANPTLFQQLRAFTHPERVVGVPDGI